jgi:C-terminal processing protease CtpA/Prc
LALLAHFLFIGALVGCGPTCDSKQLKRDILSAMQEYYLWNSELSIVEDQDAIAGQDFMQALIAKPRSEGKDCNFSHLTSVEASERFYVSGQSVGFGLNLNRINGRLFVVEIFPKSAAEQAGFHRGDEILAISANTEDLNVPANQVPAILATDFLARSLKSWELGTTRFFRLKRAGLNSALELSVTSGLFALDPVPRPVVIEGEGGRKIAYLMLRSFIAPAEPLLKKAMAQFREVGVTDAIIDFRYNAGGSASVAELLLNLLHGGFPAGSVMYQRQWNESNSNNNTAELFKEEAGAIAPNKIAFIVTGSSASASELVVNSLLPEFGSRVAIVGSRTFGKPVAQVSARNKACSWLISVVAFQLVNAAGQGAYFQGLPYQNFSGSTVAAEDDLSRIPGDPTEASTAAALAWIASGARPKGPIPEVNENRSCDLRRAQLVGDY